MDLYEELENPISFARWVPKRWVQLELTITGIFSAVNKMYPLPFQLAGFHYGKWWKVGAE